MQRLSIEKYREYHLLFIVFIILFCIINISCKKNWLDAKTQKSLTVPSTIEDFKALLSGTVSSEPAFNDFYGMACEMGTDYFYIADNIYDGASPLDRNLYIWKSETYSNTGITNLSEWDLPYKQIYYSNIVLEGIKKIIPQNNSQSLDWNQINGSALFFRAVAHYSIAREFCKPYVKNNADSDLGIPLRLHADFNDLSKRSSVEETYNLIISDLKQSASYLQIEFPINTMYQCIPNKAAAYGMLARVYLAMSEYDSAFIYSAKCLELYDVLLDYNDPAWVNLGVTGTAFKPFNPEILFYKRGVNFRFFQPGVTKVDTTLYKLYDNDDLRQKAYFFSYMGGYTYKGSYIGLSNFPFAGLATDEIYLIRAECNARLGRINDALVDVNTLLVKRWKKSVPFPLLSASTASEALTKILTERRKELCFRSTRWEDLRRLNLDPQYAVTLTKVVKGQTYTLPPNSDLYVLPIPEVVVRLTGISQNPR